MAIGPILGGGGAAVPDLHYYFIDPDPAAGVYTSYADAKAAADAAGDTSAFFVLLDDLVEDITLPRGMTFGARNQEGNPNVSVTGHWTFAGGSGTTNVIDITMIGDGAQTLFNANAGTNNLRLTNCVLAQIADFPFMSSSAGSNVVYKDCVFAGIGLVTAEGLDINEGNIVLINCGSLGTGSGIFADVSGGSLEIAGYNPATSILQGTIITSNNADLIVSQHEQSGTTSPVFDLNSSSAAEFDDVVYSSTDNTSEAIQGTGEIEFNNLRPGNVETRIESTIVLTPVVPIPQARRTVEVDTAAFAVTTDFDYFNILRTATGASAINLPPILNRDGLCLTFKDKGLNASANNITITPDGAETIDGAANLVLNTDGASVTLISEDGEWWIN